MVASHGAFSCFILFVVLMLCLVDSVWHCNHLVGEEGAGCHYENTPIQIYMSSPKTENFQTENSNFFYTSAQNIDCGYPLEPPRQRRF